MRFRAAPRSVSQGLAILVLGVALGVPIGAVTSPRIQIPGLQAPADTSQPVVEAAETTTGERPDMALFREAWRTVNDEFVNRSALDERRMTYGAIRGMVQSLGDSNTLFQTPEERQSEMGAFSGRFQGIGTYIDARDSRIVILSSIEGSPGGAERCAGG